MSTRILYIAPTFPSLTVTFIYREIESLKRWGFEIETVSMNRPSADALSVEARPFLELTLYLDEVSIVRKLYAFASAGLRHPIRMGRCAKEILRAQPTKNARDYGRLAYHWLEASYLHKHFNSGTIDHIHAHFVNGPSSIAMFLSLISGVRFSFTMHASMIWLDPIALRNKLHLSVFGISISEFNKEYVLSEYGESFRSKIHIVRCGIEPQKIPDSRRQPRSLRREILGVGQLNARKGFHILIEACWILAQRGQDFHCTIVGDGEERQRLDEMRIRLNLEDRISLVGAKRQEELFDYMQSADIFALPCVISAGGWRDGIPVALMEAMAWRIPVITSDILGLPELVGHEETGLLCEPSDAEDIANSIERLITDSNLCSRLADSGARWVLAEFNVEESALRLAKLFGA